MKIAWPGKKNKMRSIRSICTAAVGPINQPSGGRVMMMNLPCSVFCVLFYTIVMVFEMIILPVILGIGFSCLKAVLGVVDVDWTGQDRTGQGRAGQGM